MREVAERAEAEVVAGELAGLEVEGERWRLKVEQGEELWADGVVFTGAGPAIEVAGQPREHPRVFDGRTYWLHERESRKQVAQSVCVIGSGETAASVVISVLKHAHRRTTVDVLTSRGVLYSRGESFDENRFYSDPGDWPRLAESHRREFLERTDRGGRQVVVTSEYSNERERVAYALVVVAIGFDPRAFEALLGDEARARLERALAGDELQRRIELDLSVAGMSPRLHLPVLAGLAQGPGFPNLSCLGLLSDRILRSYVSLEKPASRVESERRELV